MDKKRDRYFDNKDDMIKYLEDIYNIKYGK